MNLKTGLSVIDIEIKSLQLLKKKNYPKNFDATVELLYKNNVQELVKVVI